MRNYFILFYIFLFTACTKPANTSKEQTNDVIQLPTLNLNQAQRLINLPISCVDIEYPNKLGQTIGSEEDLKSPKELHPAFYGCFDWHSSVHGHWSMVSLLKQFPRLENNTAIKNKLLEHISKENILKEVNYFKGKHNKSYERTYGWAWVLKLAEALHTWDDKLQRLEDIFTSTD
jgi:Protein of unknown function (DUF2891).